MTRDPKLTQTLEEPREDLTLRTTVVQPIPLSRHPDFVRTHYWEKLSGAPHEPHAPKRTAASYANAGQTVAGLGPDDPIVQAVQAAKQQLLAAERAQQERVSHERPCVTEVATYRSTAKTVRLPALDVLQLMASRIKPKKIEPTTTMQLPKRSWKPFLIAGGAVVFIAVVATAGYIMPAERAEQSAVKPQPQAAAPAEQAALVPEPAAVSDSAPSSLQQVSEKAAVDALFAGDYSLASRHYAALASTHPEQPAFAEAARILRRNTH